jgi:16S rRNA (uracil1498-N3)-methyltransferase
MPRFYCPVPLASGAALVLPASAARHVQVLRLQPGHALTLFNGEGGEFDAEVTRMGRSEVEVTVGAHHAVEREAAHAIHLAVGMPANERMDWLVEKATELGVASIQPLHTAHSVLRLSGERAEKKRAHWQSIAVAGCEQCGRNRVPPVHPVLDVQAWIAHWAGATGNAGFVLSLHENAVPWGHALGAKPHAASLHVLIGPEGGLNHAEENAALAAGLQAVSLGARVLRTETAAIAVLSMAPS